MKKLFASFFRFYIDWPLMLVFVLLVVLFRVALLDELFLPVAKVLSTAASNSIGATLLLGIISNLFTAFLVAIAGLLFFRQLMRARLSGSYQACQIQGSVETPYGTATILFAPLALDRNGVPVKLKLKHNDIELEGRGLIVNNRTMIGHYTEIGKPERRRCGSFFYQLDGNGQSWQGKFVFVSPDKEEIEVGEGKWVRT